MAVTHRSQNLSQFCFPPKHVLLIHYSTVCAHHSEDGAEINGCVVWHQHARLEENSKTSMALQLFIIICLRNLLT